MNLSIEKYVKYLVGLQKWINIDGGNSSADGNVWSDKEGQIHFHHSDEYILDYIENAYAETPMKYSVLGNCNPKLPDEFLDDDKLYIIKNLLQWK